MNLLPRSSRLRRTLAIAVGLVAAFTLGGFFILPVVVKAQLEKRLGAELGRTVTVGKVRINPYELSATLEDFDLREADGRSSFVAWRRLHVNFEAIASLQGSWVLAEIELDGLRAAVQVKPDGAFNFTDILTRLTPRSGAPASAPGRPLRIARLQVSQARVEFTDQSRPQPFAATLGPTTFAVTNFHTGGAGQAPYQFEAVTEAGEKLGWSGTLQAAPFRSQGEFRLEDIPLAKYAPYYAGLVPAEFPEGKVTVRGRYEVNLAPAARVIRLLETRVQLRGLKVREPASGEFALELPSVDVTGINADAVAAKVAVGAIALSGGHLRARRARDGSINLVSMFQPPAAAPATPAPSAGASAVPGAPPTVSVDDLTLQDFAVDFSDLAAPRPVQLGLRQLRFSLKTISLTEGASMPLQLAFDWAPRGTVRLAGSVSIRPELRASLESEVAGLAILPLSPYLEQFVNARVTEGAVSTTHQVQLAMAGGAPAVTLAGNLTVEKFGLVDGMKNEELAGVAALTLDGLKVTTAPQLAVSLAEVKVDGPYARLIVNPDKSLNLAGLAPATAATPAATASRPGDASPAPAPTPQIGIDRVVISAGEFSFDDRSVQPHVRTTLGRFGGTISGLSSANLARADVALQGAVDGAGPVAITGRLDPLGAAKFVDLKVDFKNVDLVPLSPYSGRFAGFELARGKLGIDTRFHLETRKIDATNVVTLDQFTFGAPVESPEATKLPVRLGVALLKDLSGRIVIDLPIQGALDDPEFKIGRVVVRVLVNLLTKAAVSPFKLLGSMFGGGGEELAFQQFAPGHSELLPAELPKLATLVKALTNRPGLSLVLEGGYDPDPDTHALKRVKLADQVRRAVWETKHATDPNIPPPEQLVVSPAEEAAMIKTLYDRKFPPGTEFGTPLPPPPRIVPPPEPPRGFLQRFIRNVTGRAKRERLAVEAENERQTAAHQQALAQAVQTGQPMAEMLGRLAEAIEVNDNDLAALAGARAQRVRDYLITTGPITPDRLFLAKTAAAAQGGRGPRVFLSLQ